MNNMHVDQPDPRPTSADVLGMSDCNLQGGTKSPCEVGIKPNPPTKICDNNFNETIQNLPEKLGFLLRSKQNWNF